MVVVDVVVEVVVVEVVVVGAVIHLYFSDEEQIPLSISSLKQHILSPEQCESLVHSTHTSTV